MKVFFIRSKGAKSAGRSPPNSEGSQIGGTITTLSESIRAALEAGRRDGFVTFDQLNEWLPPATTEPEHIENLFETLRDEGIDVRDP